jgi:hypothetical protein
VSTKKKLVKTYGETPAERWTVRVIDVECWDAYKGILRSLSMFAMFNTRYEYKE